jgi:hypothetical protein
MRKFIILENNAIEYLKSRYNKGKGYVKLECRDSKGKILFNVDGLENVEGKVYKGSLLTKWHGKLIEVEAGIIEVNEKGKGNLEWRFNPRSVGGTGVSIEDFKYVLVKLCGYSKSDSDLIIPLAGYISQKDGSLDSVVRELEQNIKSKEIHSNEEDKQAKPQESIEQEQKPLDVDIKEKEEIKESFGERKYNIGFRVRNDREDMERMQQEANEELEELQQETEQEKDEIQEIREEIIEDTDEESDENKNEKKEKNDEYEEYSSQQEQEENDKEEEASDNKRVDNKEQSEKYQFIEAKDEDNYFIRGKNKDYRDNISYSNTNFDYQDNMNNYGHSVSQNRDHMENMKSYSKHVANYSMNILKFFEKVEPFNEEMEGYTWWEIEYDSKNVYRGFLPFYNYIVNIRYPYPFMTRVTTCQSLMRKYNHYIFGIYEKDNEIKYYVYGIPGKLTKEEQPYRGMTGFQTWIEKKGNDKERLGYWLLHIDAISGKIVNPLRPTPPRRFR